MNQAASERIITIFGGSKCAKSSAEYREAMELGGRLAQAGFTICTGGYLGIMEAASRGAREKGGRVFGIVMNQFKHEPNRYLTDKVATNHFYERLQNLITRAWVSSLCEVEWALSQKSRWFGINFKRAC